jgi:heme-degrading monooxygenase HmoA
MSVWEIAEIDVVAGEEKAFEAAYAEAQPLFEAAKGCVGVQLRRSVEFPSRYRLVVGWESVEAHTVDFRGSEGFARWRELVGRYFDGAPRVEHVYRVAGSASTADAADTAGTAD